MKPVFQRLTAQPEEGFAFKIVQGAGFDCPWHVHPEFELIHVLEANGYRIVGDKIAPLTGGDLVLVGPGLPHIWQHEPTATCPRVHALLIQFEPDFLGEPFLRLPALGRVRHLLDRAARGLHITGPTHDAIAGLIAEMPRRRGLDRIVQLLRILGVLSESKDCQPLASASFATDSQPYDEERMNRAFQFLNAHVAEEVRLADVAREVSLSEGAFSRFFRIHAGKTFPEFLNELRIGRACRLLVEGDRLIAEVAYACGFTNLSNFNRQFRRLKGSSPREFREQLQRRLAEAPRVESGRF